VLTTFDEDEILWGAIDAGAAGFILKEATAEDLIRATRTVAEGGSWLDPIVTPRVLAHRRDNASPVFGENAKAEELTDRENEVLLAMARGLTNNEIAGELIVGIATVKSHIGSIFSKLGVRDRAGAIVFAYQSGIISPQ
jgi:DNA-binding NarL/FixJ family response regulator